ncbi:50S ribosomal protein L9 [Mycoplasmopsis columboralis]|uniref:Large ribosomal subunit protein bL9 n=1 Tax=Mycoplasmopsis columboralis TaxID=171282 RepID=A0A449B6E4_9BACT|nr:50S ribosomal protein L9 [Mycoplasmopsis columboralis]VEU76181.1 50S ribosomal protein L9 [Mycoplasmopsis columboralis]
MKVILIKDCKDGKANTIVEVSNGYGTNFLIKGGYALPYNEKTAKSLERKLQQLSADEHQKRSEYIALKEQLEQVLLKFELKAAVDKNHNLNVHKSVSTKEVHDELKKLGYNLPKHALEKIHFVSEGSHEVMANLYKDINATIRLEITINVTK